MISPFPFTAGREFGIAPNKKKKDLLYNGKKLRNSSKLLRVYYI